MAGKPITVINPKEHIIIYTDGGCDYHKGGTSFGSWGAILIFKNHIAEYFGAEVSGGATNNRMEMLAVIVALRKLTRPMQVYLYTDSKYVINCAKGVWQKRANQDLWYDLDALLKIHRVYWRWVRGHDGNKYNTRCDDLSTEAQQVAIHTNQSFTRLVKKYDEVTGVETESTWSNPPILDI